MEHLGPIVAHFKELVAKFAPEVCLKRASEAGTDAREFGRLYERIDVLLETLPGDLLTALPGASFAGIDPHESYTQDLFDDREDLRQLLGLVERALEVPGPSNSSEMSSPPPTTQGTQGQPSRQELEDLKNRLIREQLCVPTHVGRSTQERGGEGAHPGHPFLSEKHHLHVIPKHELTDVSLIGEGAYGAVSRATWQGRVVAVKQLLEEELARMPIRQLQKARDDFVKEIEAIALVDHKGIIKMLGACLEPPAHEAEWTMVMELAEFGNLYSCVVEDGNPSSLGTSLDILLQIAEAVEYLHRVGIVHRDLKSMNVLVCERRYNDEKIVVRLADFGVAKVKHDTTTALTSYVGTTVWMAPEVFENKVYRSSADVYSFAILAYEVLTRTKPYRDIRGGHAGLYRFTTKVMKGMRPKFPPELELPPAITSLVEACWAGDPTERPVFKDIVATLRAMPELQRFQERITELEGASAKPPDLIPPKETPSCGLAFPQDHARPGA